MEILHSNQKKHPTKLSAFLSFKTKYYLESCSHSIVTASSCLFTNIIDNSNNVTYDF